MSAAAEREIQERKRRERLALSLRENLKRRKAQSRGRAERNETGVSEAPPSAADRGL
jgi:hypothetical protein